ncbi:NAD(P)-dependent dehydrogenase (short-subunit alcohol dehydrogenase family) [Leucobacter exalbidus]|uniref:NAD(P)-dependent dehydrogenase (Short-subunit alcohol dehydrogenase family) n=1 Tax=Leucobacter exalbidus TaxID=662960 RepID=A0A940T3N5_9MICO|nr:SDR family oxidoreductase [Leucobacter exalbidus]MBP1325998.1 NAD(P)-dependent dehydrogenase (short-subunit alcohol dehydrogenase family) [Leucobacter exalbidus]
MTLTIDMTGQVVLITGGTQGVGAATARKFTEAGAHVEVCGRTTPEPGAVPWSFTALDVRRADQVEAWVAEVLERRGRIDIVVNNAGGSPFGRFEEGSPRYYSAITELNFLSATYLARAAYPALKEARGSVINITSISARRPSPGTAIYGAAKAALENLTGSLGAEWAPDVRVNAISCGLIATDSALSHYGDEEQMQRVAATIPRGQLASPEEIANAVLLLASPLAGHITGATLDVDGGGEWPSFLGASPNGNVFVTAPAAV